jgi:CMP-N-acetylneuraminic acid synthetase
MEINLYKEAVSKLAANRTNSRFSNKGTDHAKVVIEHIFGAAEESVRWYSGCIASDFLLSAEIQKAMNTYLERQGAELVVITEFAADPQSLSFLKSFGDKAKVFSLEHATTETKQSLPTHFMVADGKSFRLETDNVKREAIVNFNDPAIAARLTELFDNAIDAEFNQK